MACKEEVFVTKSNREVKLRIFVKPKDLEKVDFAMLSLKNSMKWDEVTFGEGRFHRIIFTRFRAAMPSPLPAQRFDMEQHLG